MPQDIDLTAWRDGTMTKKQKAEIIADIAVNGFAKLDGSGGKYKKPDGWPENNINYTTLGVLYNSHENLTTLTGDFDTYLFPCHNETYPDLSFEENDTEFYKELNNEISKIHISTLILPFLQNVSITNAMMIIGFYHGNYPDSQSYKKYYEKAIQYAVNSYNAGSITEKDVMYTFCNTSAQGEYTPFITWSQFDKISKNNNDPYVANACKIARDMLATYFAQKMKQNTDNCNTVVYGNNDGRDLPEKIEDLPNSYFFQLSDASGPQGILSIEGNKIELLDAVNSHKCLGYHITDDGHEEFYVNGITTIDSDPYRVKDFLLDLKKKCFEKAKKEKNKPKIKPNPPKLPKIPKIPYIPDYNPLDDDKKKKDKKDKKDKDKKQKKPEDKEKDFYEKLEKLRKKRQQEEDEQKKQEEERKAKKEKEDKYNAEMAPLKKQEEEIEAKKPKRRNMTLLEKIIVGLLIITIVFAIIVYLVIQHNIDKEYKIAMDKYDKDIKDIKNKMNLINKKYGHAPVPMM